MDKTALLNRFYANRKLFEQTVSQVSETGMLEPPGPDQHTGKGIIAHLTAWEQPCFLTFLSQFSTMHVDRYTSKEEQEMSIY